MQPPKYGYYPGDAPTSEANLKNRPAEAAKVSINDIKRITEKLSGTSQRRRRLQARTLRSEAEELDRLRLDEEFRKDAQARRTAVIERARRMQEGERDAVKQLHSRLLLYNVLQVRDTQLVLKKERLGRETLMDDKYKTIASARNAEAEVKEKISAENARSKKYALAEEQRRQHQEKIEKEAVEADALMEQGLAIRRAADEYRAEQQKLETEHQKKRIVIHQELSQMKSENNARQEKAKLKEADQQHRNEAWVARKERQTAMKKDFEQKWFNEALRARELMGERQAKDAGDVEAKLNEQIARAVALKDEIARRDQAKREEIKKKQGEEVKKYYYDFKTRRAQERQTTKEEDAATLQLFLRQRDEYLESERQKKAHALEKGREFQKIHQAQMEESRRVVTNAKMERKNDSSARDVQEREASELQSYMKGIASEPWAVNNHRIQEYLQKTLAQKSHS
ncbi:hypothetical protein SmJEL517_g03111 [Synchytrium microbalum]|uniref:Trichohyalin-plectin-homology domain-containing protein n=1 Tax=Synchytrium microbalum TaxID=1806994 RepID=A0A507C9C5_9FUNG|nr:uncharacterized protein SmJEL517_g03111 [Synchytrium microbalum]TPX34143.1 hypothetical protein SmJEL517_g03111 [Synchytrium microbalum]